ncbi:MAG: biotin/lipoyl-binding protein [Deltaproteobacteria bacterium]|nr:biotin/lipoyl-binding protein [Deltaproteobacteria bacterium]
MEYEFETGDRTLSVAFHPEKPGRASARIGEASFEIRYARVSANRIRMTVNGSQVNAWVEKESGGKIIILDGERYRIRDRHPQDRPRTRSAGPGQEPSAVTPPMPAIVVLVPVAEGDWVEKGQIVIVISAMKMETSLKAPHSGRITRVTVNEGDKVMPGDILVDIEAKTPTEGEIS